MRTLGGGLLLRPGVGRISELDIDVDKGWSAMGISNIAQVVAGMAKGDLLFHDGASLARIPPGTAGAMLTTQGMGANPQWGY